jgi:hypothetical protein
MLPKKVDNTDTDFSRELMSGVDHSKVWFEVKDENTKKVFYYNKETQTSQWERPVDVEITPIKQKGVAVILGNGVIEKSYMSSALESKRKNSSGYNTFVNENEHIYDPIKSYQKQIFPNTESDTTQQNSEKTPEDTLYYLYFSLA